MTAGAGLPSVVLPVVGMTQSPSSAGAAMNRSQVLLGVHTRSRIEDTRPPLTPGQPELRQYTLQYRDGDQPVSEMFDVCRVTVQP